MSFFEFHYHESNAVPAEVCAAGYYVAVINIDEVSSFDCGTLKLTMKGEKQTWYILADDCGEELTELLGQRSLNKKQKV